MSIKQGLVVASAALCLLGAAESAGPDPNSPFLVPDRMKADTVVILAHPDDEGVVAPLLARDALVGRQRIVNLYVTSGEMGADRVGGVQGPAFGSMRLMELHWTLDRLGVAMFFPLGRSDVSIPGDPDAVVAAWDRERTVRELTRYLRLLRPNRVLAWVPGPASGHPAHMASGAMALLACRASANPAASPEQMQTEGLRVWEIPEVMVFAQAEKVAYDRYPMEKIDPARTGLQVEVFDPASYDGSLRRRYGDLAREALKEQRSVGMGAGQERGGPFDEPLELVRVFGSDAPRDKRPTGNEEVRIVLDSSGVQRFFERTMEEVGAPEVLRAFPPEAAVGTSGSGEIAVRIVNGGKARLQGRAVLSLPEGWIAEPGPLPLTIETGGIAGASWNLKAPPAPAPRFGVAEIRLETGGKKPRDVARLRFVVGRPIPAPAP